MTELNASAAEPVAPHLWEIDHPYYCSDQNFFRNDRHVHNDSWAEFMQGWGHSDPDMNLLFRWDWKSWRHHPDPDLRSDSPDELDLFFLLQRKGDFWAVSVAVTDEDEAAVREWLTERARTITAIWEPINLTAGSGEVAS